MSVELKSKGTEILPIIRESIDILKKQGKISEEKKSLYEQLVVTFMDPRMEWGKNNLRDLIILFHESGKTAEQIYNILYNMGVDKETAYDGIIKYLPDQNSKKNIVAMEIKEQLNISGKIQSLIDRMKSYNTGDSLNYTANVIIGICESYLQKYEFSGLSVYDHAQIAKRLISELNQYDYIKPVSEAIKSIESDLSKNIMYIQVDGLYNKIASISNPLYKPLVNKLAELKTMNESEIKENSLNALKEFNYVPEVKLFLEAIQISEDINENKSKSAVSSFNLKGRLKQLVENISKYSAPNSTYTINSIKAICEKYINQLYKGNIIVSEFHLSSNLIKELSPFMWIDSVNETVSGINSYINENLISFQLDDTLRKLKNMTGNSFYSNAIIKLEEINNLSESEIRERVKYELQDLDWIPEVKRLIESVNKIERGLNSNTEALIKRVYSPVFNIEGNHFFYLNGKVYSIDESNQLKEIDPKTLSALYLTLIAVSENFNFIENKARYYKGKNSIEFELLETGVNFKFNDEYVPVKDSSDIRNFLLSNGSFSINDVNELEIVVKAYENLDSFVELDFVQSIHSRTHKGIIVNVIRLNENLYINRINPYMAINELIKADTSTDAVNLVKEYVNYDISEYVVDLLEDEIKKQAIIEAKKESLFDKINFLKEQRSRLSELNMNDPIIKEADNLLANEIKVFEKQINELIG